MVSFLNQLRRVAGLSNARKRPRTQRSKKSTVALESLETRVLLSAITGTVYDDVDSSGTKTGQDNTLGGWQVYVALDNSGTLNNKADGTLEPSAKANAGGDYTINMKSLPTGLYRVTEIVQPGWTPTTPASRDVVFTAGKDLNRIDFFNFAGGDIVGTVWNDLNADGVRAVDAGTGAFTDPGLEGWTVFLDLKPDGGGGVNGILDPGEPSTTTDAFGQYHFSNLPAGDYEVTEIQPAGWDIPPGKFDTKQTVTVVALSTATQDFANFSTMNGSIEGTALDPGESNTVTLADGSYSFTGLTPGAYVVREVLETGFGHSYPTTTSGTLWPAGTSNPAQGNVSPASITTSLAVGQSFLQTVSLTLPGTGSLTNAVDVFLLFDDTGSFTNNSPVVRAAFPNIITQLQTSLSGTDLAFGTGRFEEYGNFASEYSTGRPFILNQPMVASSTAGYMTAIQAALNRTTPGYGGDGPETDIEALYQLVTGLGFDGNNNGTVSDSGAAGLSSTQLIPGNSGDVPSFASFTADVAANVLPAAGTIGGAGFRAGALPVILLATDIGFAYQPKGETSITGANGLTLPMSALTGTSRPSTPFNSGAGLQETITGLNALGALVIGLGTNTQANVDPRQGLEAISKLTGAINRTTTTIANGTVDPIAPGDPLYFQISSGFATSVADGVKNAIQNAVTNVAMNITVQASDPRVRIVNHTGTRNGVGSGQTATFDIEFIGDGIPHRFDLQFVREGTSVVLGSIPVVLGTPIPGDGYHFDDLAEGQIELEDHFGDKPSAAAPANVAPTFVAGANQIAAEDAGAQSIAAWATSISPGPVSEAGQIVNFVATNDNPGLFDVQPSVSPTGLLSFTSAPNAFGTATITVVLHDNGGTAIGGIDTSSPQQFTIAVTAVNDAPVAVNDTYSIAEDTTLVIGGPGLLANDTDVDGDVLSVTLVTGPSHGSLLLNTDGSFSYTPSLNYNGPDSFTYVVNDGTVNSTTATVTLTVTAVHDAPVSVNDTYSTNAGTQVNVILPGVLRNDTDVDGDALTAVLVSAPSNGTLLLNPNGSFTYTPAVGFSGTDSFTYRANDGTANSGTATVTITVNPIVPPPPGDVHFFVVDTTSRRTFEYDDAGGTIGNPRLNTEDTKPLGIATNIDGTVQWVIDDKGEVFVYNNANRLIGNWEVKGIDKAEGITVHGDDLWIVDRANDRVYMFAGGATLRSGSAQPSSNFVLAKANGNAKDLVTDGSHIWVVNDSASVDRVFRYSMSGQIEGNWDLDTANRRPTGIAVAPDGSGAIYVVDATTDRVYRYDNGMTQLSATLPISGEFALNSLDGNAQGIAAIVKPSAAVALPMTILTPVAGLSSASLLTSHKTDALIVGLPAGVHPAAITVATPAVATKSETKSSNASDSLSTGSTAQLESAELDDSLIDELFSSLLHLL